jgi:hypothetical protein
MLGYLWYGGLFGLVSGSLAVMVAIVRGDNALLKVSAWFLAISGAAAAVGFIGLLVYISNDPS